MNIENKLYGKDKDPMPGGADNPDTIGMIAMDARVTLEVHALQVAWHLKCTDV